MSLSILKLDEILKDLNQAYRDCCHDRNFETCDAVDLSRAIELVHGVRVRRMQRLENE